MGPGKFLDDREYELFSVVRVCFQGWALTLPTCFVDGYGLFKFLLNRHLCYFRASVEGKDLQFNANCLEIKQTESWISNRQSFFFFFNIRLSDNLFDHTR